MARRLKILLLCHEYPPVGGGGGNAARHLSSCLTARGIDVTVLTSAFGNEPTDTSVNGVRVVRVSALRACEAESTTASILAYTATAFATSLSLPRPDLIHAFFGIPGGAVAYALKKTMRLPYIVSFRGKDVHGGKSRDFGGITGLLKCVSNPIWRSADALVANSQGLKGIAQNVDPLAIVDVIPNGVDTTRFSPRSDPGKRGPVVILFVGRLESFKGLDTLLLALSAISRQNAIEFVMKIAGDGPLRKQLTEEASRLGIATSVEFLGWIPSDDIAKVYQSADIFVLPSVVEGMPNGVLESMATGLPAIATKVPGTEELIESGRTGITFPVGDSDALAAALCTLIQDETIRKRMGQAAREAAQGRSWEAVAEEYIEVYDRVIARS